VNINKNYIYRYDYYAMSKICTSEYIPKILGFVDYKLKTFGRVHVVNGCLDHKYILITGCEVRTERQFSQGLRSGSRRKAKGSFWSRGEIFFVRTNLNGK
jgi:hypothetical protein